jgi:lactoylglutathione lyase
MSAFSTISSKYNPSVVVPKFDDPDAVTVKENPLGWRLQQTMLRIKDPKITIPYYEKNYGFQLLHKYDFPEWKFSLYFLGILDPERAKTWPEAGSKEAGEELWKMGYGEATLELTHNWGTEEDDSYTVNNGNVEPHRGFGHIAVMTSDVYAACAELEANGVRFQKKPDEGRMKGLAFALDPDSYWIEVISRSADSVVPTSYKYTLAQTMFRIKDPKKSLEFYTKHLNMTLLRECHFGPTSGAFSLYFLTTLPPGASVPSALSDKSSEYIRQMFPQVLELTHNHGTELEENNFRGYHNGNDENLEADPPMKRGFGHVGFLVNDLADAVSYLDANGVTFKKRPEEGMMRHLAFAYDPDMYLIEIIQAGTKE